MKSVKEKIGIALAIIFYLFLLAIILSLVIALILGYQSIRVTSTDKYLEIKGLHTLFILFPENLNDVDRIDDYHYYDDHLKDGAEVYLDAYYAPQEFAKELERLEDTEGMSAMHKLEKQVKKDESVLFHYTTFVAKYNDLGKYEYACVDYENYHIVYIYLYCRSTDSVTFDKVYLPKKYDIVHCNVNHDDPYSFDVYAQKEWKDSWYE